MNHVIDLNILNKIVRENNDDSLSGYEQNCLQDIEFLKKMFQKYFSELDNQTIDLFEV